MFDQSFHNNLKLLPLAWYFFSMGIECIAVLVLRAPNFSESGRGVYLKDGVLRPINVGIYPQAKEMLMVVCVNPRVDFGPHPFVSSPGLIG